MPIRKTLLLGLRDTLPMMAGSAPLGLIFGALGAASELGPLATLAMSLFVYAGSAQFVAVGLVAQQASVMVLWVTTLLINARHVLYGPTLRPHLEGVPRPLMALLAFWLTDETFAVAAGRFSVDDSLRRPGVYMLGSALAMYINWQVWTVLGIVVGYRFEGLGELGLDFAMVVTFIGIAVPLITTLPMLVCALAAGGAALLLADLPYQGGLVVASVVGVGAGVLIERLRGEVPPA